MEISKLDKKKHERKTFDCGVAPLNAYLKQTARQHDTVDYAHTYVLTSAEHAIIGYYTLSTCTIRLTELPEPLNKRYPTNLQCVLIGRLAVDQKHQQRGHGSTLLMNAIARIVEADMPLPLLIVDAKDEQAKRFYEAFGFELISPNSMRLYMPLSHARTMFEMA
ncbi:MAG: GNAT family N-acetyltransferase [Ferrimonas sp.]